MTEREDPSPFPLELRVRGRESGAGSVCPRLPGLPSGLGSAAQAPGPLPGHGGAGPASGGAFLRLNPAMLLHRGLAGGAAGGREAVTF